MAVTIYHNPRCSKSRQTLALLESRGVKPRVVEYLKTPPDRATIEALLRKLGIAASQLVRRKEPEFAALGLDAAGVSEERLIDAMASHPKLIERPIVVVDRRARIGRPPEAVLEILP
ncbi:MAG TPA: arsenate reductase (glutaredoxin) [Gammaproteobacteria bacterium]|nr:arsenate reductase (glutaredoxin) [Gammaproteobacteria bacterium]